MTEGEFKTVNAEPPIETRLLEWANVLDIPSGDFVNEDLRLASRDITRLRTALADREAKLEKAREALRPFARLSHFVGDCGVADEGHPGNTAIIEAELFKQAATTLKDIT